MSADIMCLMINVSRLALRGRTCILAGFMLLLPHTSLWAEISPEKIFINADHMQFNIESGHSVYTGQVKISQGALVLTGDKVTVEQSNNEVEQITVLGKPARYNHVTEKGETIEAESEQMVYTASQSKLVMTGNASLKQPDHQVSSKKIIYDTLKKIVIAGDRNISSDNERPDETERVNITLTPKKQDQSAPQPSTEQSPTEK